MKRSEMVEKLAKIYETAPEGFSAYHICDILLGAAERAGMHYCPVEDLGDFGKLRTPKTWEEE